MDVVERRHAYGMGCKQYDRLAHFWNDMFKFVFMRNPWRIIESDFNLLMRDVAAMHSHSKMELHDRWYKKLMRVKGCRSFSEYVAREYLGRNVVWEGGFWRTWCCGKEGEDLGFEVFSFENIKQEWPKICARLHINTPLKEMNSAQDLHFMTQYSSTVFANLGVELPKIPKINFPIIHECVWTPATRDAIGEMCYLDIEKFGYEFQGQLKS